MHRELDVVLCSNYPKIFLPNARHDQASFGIGCGDGWYKLIDAACALIQVHSGSIGQQLVATQVKQKFGGMRFYCRGGDDYAASVISLVESLSYHVCELCGAVGKGGALFGSMQTRCPAHQSTSAFEDVLGESGRQQFSIDPIMNEMLGFALAFFDYDGQATARWLTQPAIALGKVIPLSLSGSLDGQHRVIDVLGRLQHGIPQ